MASMHSLFNWAIQHTDQNALHQSVANGTAQNTIPAEWMEAILKTDAEKMGTLIKMYQDDASSLAIKETCLEELEFFVQILDNANDLNHTSVNGLKPLIDGLKNPQPTLRALSAFALGTALQNNPKVQLQVMQMNGLVEMISAFEYENSNPNYYSLYIMGKLLYALMALLDLNPKMQKDFRDSNGFNLIHQIMSKPASHYSFPAPAISEPNVQNDDNEEDEVEPPKDPNTVEVIDIVDRVRKAAKKRRSEINETAEQQYLRLIRKIIFLILKLISQTEQFKLAVVKDLNGILIEDLTSLAIKYADDFDVVDKTVSLLNALVSGPMKTYVAAELKKWKSSIEELRKLVQEDKERLDFVLKEL